MVPFADNLIQRERRAVRASVLITVGRIGRLEIVICDTAPELAVPSFELGAFGLEIIALAVDNGDLSFERGENLEGCGGDGDGMFCAVAEVRESVGEL